jgi:transcriptional regulator with XRE-family HTH domain
MSANKSLTSPAIETFEDELDSHIAESLKDPEYLAASVDVERRLGLIRSLVILRKKLGLTQAQVARRMGVGQPTVSGFENEGSDPRLSTVQRYARAVEAECLVAVQPALRCDWIAPSHIYQEAIESATKVRVDRSAPSDVALGWAAADANRNDFAMAA